MTSRVDPLNGPGFLDHLESLRRRLFVVFGSFVAATVGTFLVVDHVFTLLFLPFERVAPELIAIRPQEVFVTYLQVAAFVGAVVSVPILLLEVIGFVRPALEPNERGPFEIIHATAQLFYFAGLFFSVFVVAPFALRFFRSFGESMDVAQLWSIGEYVKLLRRIVIAITVVFQTPLVMILVTKAGLIETRTLRRYRKHALIAAFVCGAFLSPPDVFTQILVGGTLYGLFELSLILAGLLSPGTGGNGE
jgi:sec-independent protein translocase protein TatC